MPTYAYEAMNQAGHEVKDEVDANTTEDALAKIKSLGFFPTKIREKGGTKAKVGGKRKSTGIAIGGVGLKALTSFTRQLSTLVDAGLPIMRSLNILEEQQKPGKLKNVLRQTAEDIEGGATLSEAMAKHPKVFNRLYVNMVAAGETGGVLDTILQRLAEFMEKAAKLRRKIIGALIYPVVVIGFAFSIVGGIMYFVIPKFKDIFNDFDCALPRITEVLIGISDWFVHGKPPGMVVIVAAPIIMVVLFKLVRASAGGRYVTDVVGLKIPVFGSLLEKSAVARFTRTLGTLITAGVPILEAIIITKETAGNEVFARALQSVHDSIREGESFHAPLRASKVVDSLVVHMVAVGEETGELDTMLMKVADNYDEEVDVLVAGLVSLLEPIMVLVLGSMVGFIVLALFMPLVALMESVS